MEKTNALWLDTEHLGKYTLGDEALEREVLQMFVEQAAQCLQRLQDAGSPKEWGEAAHSLKGSACGVGAFRLAAQAARLEKRTDPLDNNAERSAILAPLRDDLQATKDAIINHLDKKTASTFI